MDANRKKIRDETYIHRIRNEACEMRHRSPIEEGVGKIQAIEIFINLLISLKAY